MATDNQGMRAATPAAAEQAEQEREAADATARRRAAEGLQVLAGVWGSGPSDADMRPAADREEVIYKGLAASSARHPRHVFRSI